MFSSKADLEKLEKTNKRAMRMITNESNDDYNEICRKENQMQINKHCIKAVSIQMYKVKNNLCPDYLTELFEEKHLTYDMRDNDNFNIPNFKSVKYGKKSLMYYGPKLWSMIPLEIKNAVSLSAFKSAITKWLLHLEDVTNMNYV